MDTTILEVPCADRKGEAQFSAAMLREFGFNYSMTPEKIRELWSISSQHDVLFSDDTGGKVEPFVAVALNPSSVWIEIKRGGEVVGAAYLTSVIPGFDAEVHFAFWDSVAQGREAFILLLAERVMDRYRLRRLSAAIPPYQSGTIRFARSLGFVQEGIKREAVPHKGKMFPLILFGMTRAELDEALRRAW